MKLRHAYRALFVLLVFSAFTLTAHGQTAQVTGQITDSGGAVVPGVEVTVSNVETGVDRKVTSNDEGYYTVPLLTPGDYEILVQKQGFRPVTRSGVNLRVEQTARVDFALEIGEISEQVNISAAAPLLESETASRGQVIDNRVIEELPLNGRNFLQLARLTPGVVEPPTGDRAVRGGSFSVNGVRSTLNNFLLDGVDNNARIVDIQNGSNVVVQPSVDAVQEFKVQTSNYSAEFGYSAGGVINATIKSGGNDFHGSLFEFVRNDRFDARNFFLPPSQPKQKLRRNQFGGSVGGPLNFPRFGSGGPAFYRGRDKAFFFGSYEGTRERRGQTYVRFVPDAPQRQGDFSGLNRPLIDPFTNPTSSAGRTPFAGNVIPAARLDAVALRLINLLPPPNVAGSPAGNFVSSPVTRDDREQIDTRVDYNFSERDALFFRYSFTDRKINNPGPFAPPVVGSNTFTQAVEALRAHGLAISETHTFGGGVVNEARLGYNRVRDDLLPFATERLFEQFGIRGIPPEPTVTGLPEVSLAGFANIGEAAFLPNLKISETFQALDNVLFTAGGHSVKAGFNFRYVRSFFNVTGQARGQLAFNGAFTGSPVADFLLGLASTATLSNAFIGDIRYQYYGGYIQDDWKATPRLTLNLGVRYELFTPPVERNDRQGNFNPATRKIFFAGNTVPAGIAAGLVEPVPAGVPLRGLFKTDKNNFSPRLGFAYQLTERTVVRGGGGLFYADYPAVGASNRLAGSPPFRRQFTLAEQVNPNIAFRLQNGFAPDALGTFTFNPAQVNVVYWAQDFPQAYTYQYNLDVQHEFPFALVEVGYVGSQGRQLPVSFDLNQPVPGTGSVASRRPVQGFAGVITEQPFGNSSYNAFQIRGERRFSRGFSMLVAYTFGKAIDNGGEQLNGDDQRYRDVRDLRLERARALFDIRHRLVASYLVDLPFGRGRRFDFDSSFLNAVFGDFQLNGITTIRSGLPFTPSLNFSTAGAGVGDNRPDRVRDGNLPRGERTPQRWFDTGAFLPAPTNTYGNAGKNILTGPGFVNFDLSLFKNIPLGALREGTGLQLRAEAFNVFNTPQFANPNAQLQGAITGGNFVLSPTNTGGTITTLAAPMRELQLGVRLIF